MCKHTTLQRCNRENCDINSNCQQLTTNCQQKLKIQEEKNKYLSAKHIPFIYAYTVTMNVQNAAVTHAVRR